MENRQNALFNSIVSLFLVIPYFISIPFAIAWFYVYSDEFLTVDQLNNATANLFFLFPFLFTFISYTLRGEVMK